MIDKEKFKVFNYVKKEEYCGSMEGMRYMLRKIDNGGNVRLEAVIWPEPFCYAKTPEEKKQRREFAFTADGTADAADWLNQQYMEQKSLWDLSGKFF